MIEIREIKNYQKEIINSVVDIHLSTFDGFFLTFMGRGFLKQLYKSFSDNVNSGLLVAYDDKKIVGFLAYSEDMSSLYKYMIKKRLIPFAYYSFLAFLRKPKIFLRLIRAFLKPQEVVRNDDYIELSSIGVDPNQNNKGIGSLLIKHLQDSVDYTKYKYINLETDAIDNDNVNKFYLKNGFILKRQYKTHEGRLMNEYRYTR